MPLFGKKKEKEEKKSPPGGPSYPTQSAYPVQQQQYQAPQPMAPQYYVPQQGYGPPQGAVGGHHGPPPPYSANMAPAPPPAMMYQQQPNYVIQGGYDAGARFDGVAQPNVPPPPPGVMPNAAQMAMQQGANVTITQQRGNFMTGGSDGGYVIW